MNRCIISAILYCIFSQFPPPASAGETLTYRIGTVEWAGWSPLEVAEANGFWDREGVSVEVVHYDDPTVIIEAVHTGRCDLAMDMAGSIVGMYMEGRPVVALFETDWSNGGDKIIIKQGHTISEYAGGTVGVFFNLPSCLYFFGRYLGDNGLRIGDFRVVELNPPDLTAQFIAGRIPVIVSYDPHTIQALNEGDGIVCATSAQYPGVIPECMWSYRSYLDAIPDSDIRAIIRGWIRAAEWIHDTGNWEEYKTILNERTFGSQHTFTDDELRGFVGNVIIHDTKALRERNRDGGGLEQHFRDLHAFLDDNGLLTKDYAVSDIFDNRIIVDVLSRAGE